MPSRDISKIGIDRFAVQKRPSEGVKQKLGE